MGDTEIGWCHRPGTRAKTWNPVRGCSRVSEGCRHCYAERQAARIVRMSKGKPSPYDGLVKIVNGEPRWTGDVRVAHDHIGDPMRWRERCTIFVNSMSDLFHERFTDEEIAVVFAVMLLAAQHTYIVLTKRATRMWKWFEGWTPARCLEVAARYVGPDGKALPPLRAWHRPEIERERNGEGWPDWIWGGVSIEDQASADDRIPPLLETPLAVRLLSYEPMLGPVDISEHLDPADAWLPRHRSTSGRTHVRKIDWVIAGCESGEDARPANDAWFHAVAAQCDQAGVAYFNKQMMVDGVVRTDPAYFPEALQRQEWPR